jgi:zinc transporter 7
VIHGFLHEVIRYLLRVPRLGIFVGFASFFFMEKTLRVLGGEDGDTGHSHSHSNTASSSVTQASGVSASISPNGLISRGSEKSNGSVAVEVEHEPEPAKSPSKLSAYLNLFGDFVHNMSV